MLPGEYTEAEDERIRSGIADGLTYQEIADQCPGRSYTAIANRCRRIGLIAKRARPTPTPKSLRDYLRRIERENERSSDTPNADQDGAFQEAMRKAIAAGLEYAEEGVILTPCTENPKIVRPYAIQFSRSPALMCHEHGDRRAGGAIYA